MTGNHVDEDDGIRSLKISSAKNRMKALAGSSRSFLEPDHDWQLPFTVEPAGDSLWRVTAEEALEPGEYGWYVDLGSSMQSSGLYAFGVD